VSLNYPTIAIRAAATLPQGPHFFGREHQQAVALVWKEIQVMAETMDLDPSLTFRDVDHFMDEVLFCTVESVKEVVLALKENSWRWRNAR